MTQKQIIKVLEGEGYFDIRWIENVGLCGLYRFAFTVGLIYGLTESIYVGRYCYENLSDAKEALSTWNGKRDPSDSNWIKHKGSIEYSNPNKE